jgi:hypothetical protein
MGKPLKKIAQRQLELRGKLWPEIEESKLWDRKNSKGYVFSPRAMPIMLSIMDEMSKGKPVSSTYFELWCRAFDENFVSLSKAREMAFHAGFDGQRGERTWRERLRILSDLGFILLKEGPSGPMSYALIPNPYLVIKEHYRNKSSGLTAARYAALLERAVEAGAPDLDDPKT